MRENDSINIHVQRTPHVTATDFDFLDSMVREPRFHVYAPELDGADDSILTGLRKIAAGDTKVYKDVMSRTDKGSAWSKTFSALFMIKKPIESYDATFEQHKADETLNSFGRVVTDLSRMSASEFLDTMPTQLQRLPNFITVRDTVIAGNVSERLPGLIETNPKLRSLGEVGLLMTIGDNHRLVDSLLTKEGFSVTTNEIPVTGAYEKASLKYLNGGEPTEKETLEAAAYSILRNFVIHGSTYELRSQLNAAVQNVSESNIDSLLILAKTLGVKGIKDLVTHRLAGLGIDTDLTFIQPGSQPAPIKFKDTYEKRNGQMGVRTGAF